MKTFNPSRKGREAEIVTYKEDKGLFIIKYRCPYCLFSYSIIEKDSPPYYKTCGKCRGKVIINKPKEP